MKIITVFKTHFDIGFTELSSEVIKRYGGEMLESVLDTCEATQSLGAKLEYKWTMAAWPLVKSLEYASEKNRRRAEALIERGQLVWHALPFTTHTEFCGIEDFYRGFDFAYRLCVKYDKPFPLSAKMTDVPGHTRFLVSALAKAGVKFLHLGCNPASTPPKVPVLFWWEAPDGERVLTFYNGTYGSSVLPPDGWKFSVWLNMNQTNDNIGPQSADIVKRLANEIGNAALFEVGTMDDFYREIIKEDLSSLPVVREDLADTWIHGVGSYPAEVGALRKYRRELIELEKLYSAQKRNPEVEALFAKGYEAAILFAEHTWGLDVKTHLGTPRHYERKEFEEERKEPRAKKMEKSWDEQRDRVKLVRTCLESLKKTICVRPVADYSHATERGAFEFRKENDSLNIFYKGKRILSDLTFRYTVAGLDELTNFERAYLCRLPVWAIHDFGRMEYPECKQREFVPALIDLRTKDGEARALFKFDEAANRRFGMAETVNVCCRDCGDKACVKVEFKKVATPFVESASFCVTPNSHKIAVNKTGNLLDPASEIAENANHAVYCLEDYADCNDGTLSIISEHAPLLSQGEDLLFKFRPKYEKNLGDTLYFNLFNNMWGTNFPQWIEGTLCYEFEILPHAPHSHAAIYPAPTPFLPYVSPAVIHSVRVIDKGVLLRIREIEGKATEIDLSVEVCETDIFGENGKAACKKIHLKPFECKTVLMKNFH